MGIENINWVFNIANKYFLGYFNFQLGIFVTVKSTVIKSGTHDHLLYTNSGTARCQDSVLSARKILAVKIVC